MAESSFWEGGREGERSEKTSWTVDVWSWVSARERFSKRSPMFVPTAMYTLWYCLVMYRAVDVFTLPSYALGVLLLSPPPRFMPSAVDVENNRR